MYEQYTPETIKKTILAQLPDSVPKQEGSFVDLLISPMAYELWRYYEALNALIPIAFVDETSGDYIVKRAAEYGLFPKEGNKAAVTLAFTGMGGSTIPRGSIVAADNGLEFRTAQDGQIDPDGHCTIDAVGAEVGAVYNVPSGKITKFPQIIDGVTAVTNPKPATDGQNPETPEELLERLYAMWRKPAASGNVYNYEQWAMSITGVGAVLVLPLWSGNGTVKVILAGTDKKSATAAVVQQCAEYIDTQRPIGAQVTVVSAAPMHIAIAAVVTVDSAVTTVEQVKAQFETAITGYFADTVFADSYITYVRVLYHLSSIRGVLDIPSMTINGGTSNLAIPVGSVAVLSSLEVR